MFVYSIQLCLKQTFLNRRGIERYMIKMYVSLNVKYPNVILVRFFYET